MDNSFKKTNYLKFCMSPLLDVTLPESVIPQENNSPLTLYIDFYHFKYSWIAIVRIIKINHKCMYNNFRNLPHLSVKVELRSIFMKS